MKSLTKYQAQLIHQKVVVDLVKTVENNQDLDYMENEEEENDSENEGENQEGSVRSLRKRPRIDYNEERFLREQERNQKVSFLFIFFFFPFT